MNGKKDVLKTIVSVIEADVPFLFGKKTFKQWISKLNTWKRIWETFVKGANNNFKMIATNTSHYMIILETISNGEKEILYSWDKEEDLTSFESVKGVLEVNIHRRGDQIIFAYIKVRWMHPGVSNILKRVVKDCKISKEFVKFVSHPKVTLPKASLFNKIVTLEFKSLWPNMFLGFW